MYPLIDVRQFEEHGQGFGATSTETVAELNKALTAGYATDPSGKSGGGALRVESLEATLKIVSFLMKNIVFYNDIPKSKAYNTVEEYNLLSKYGGKGGFFINEGGLPRTEDANYQRKVQFVKFMGTTREITHPMLLIRPAHGNVVAQETKNGAMWCLQRMEEGLFDADSGVISQEFNSVTSQLITGYADPNTAGDGKPDVSVEHILDLRGKPMTEGIFTEASKVLLNNYMYPTHCWLNHQNHTDYNKQFFAKMRGALPVSAGGDITTGFDSRHVKTSGGTIELRPSVFLKIDQQPPTSADNAAAPTAPATVTVTVQNTTTSRGFQAGEYDTYLYQVTAISRNGESAPTDGDAGAVIIAGKEAKLVIARGAVSGNDLTQGYKIYRTRKGDASAKKYFVAKIASAGASTTFLDGNETLPGYGTAYVGQLDESVLTLRELSPMLKFPLATVASSIRWMQLYYNTPIVFRPRGFVMVKNIGPLNIPELG